MIISGGGTGGHIYPAIAIANRLKEMNSETEILFVGAKDRMEMKKVPEAGYKILGLWITGIKRSLSLDNLMFPFKLISSVWNSGKILRNFKPDVAVGVGGFASGPLLYVAAKRKIPTLIQEQNSYAGITNKLLAKKANTICVAYDNMERFFPKTKLVVTGNPVRSNIVAADENKRSEAMAHFKLNPASKTILVIGGSLGARAINESVLAGLQKLVDSGYQLLWQTGSFYFEEMKKRTSSYDLKNIRIMEFIKEMDLAYAAADVVVSRAGALSISELCLVKKPVIFIPSPNVAEDHQTKNAMALVNKNAALMMNENDAKENLASEAIQLLESDSEQEKLKNNIAALAKPNAVKDITKEIIKLIA